MRPAPPRLLAALCMALAAPAAPARAVETRVHVEDGGSLSMGDADRVAVTRSGRVFLAPRIQRLSEESWSDAPAHVWSMASDPSGKLFLGTGPDGRILEVSAAGRTRELFRVEEPMVTALAVLPGGTLLAGTAPEGRIYRIGPDGKGAPWVETEARYVWALVADRDGTVYAGTGDDGVVYRIARNGSIAPFFDADEAHVVSLALHPEGGLLAGGAGRGLLYRIDAEGNGLVVHDDDLPEVTGIAVDKGGGIVLALVAAPEADPRRPLLRIQVPQGALGPAGDGMGDMDEQRTAVLEGSIEGLPIPGESRPGAVRGRVIRISADGNEVTELWRSPAEAPFAVALDAEGRVVVGTGEPARVYRISPDGDVARLATLREAQVTAMVDAGGWMALATSNPAAGYRLEGRPEETGVFLSRPVDAGGVARWGRIRWREEGDPARVELYTRTGNSTLPDGTWSAWSPALTAPEGSEVVNPDGRYLQWRARLRGRDGREHAATGFQVSFALRNRPPEIRGFRLEGDYPAVSTEARFRFNVADPDGDPVTVEVEFRPAGGGDWRRAVVSSPVEPYDEGSPSWNDGRVLWETGAVEEGRYEVRAAAGDEPANHPGEGRRTPADGTLVVVVDRTAPTAEVRRAADGSLEIVATDGLSGIHRLELVREEQVRFRARPLDGVADGPVERFRVPPGQLEGDGWTVRVVDAAGNRSDHPDEAPDPLN